MTTIIRAESKAGWAVMRNGYIKKVPFLDVHLSGIAQARSYLMVDNWRESMATIRCGTSRGDLASGYISVTQDCLVDFSQQVLIQTNSTLYDIYEIDVVGSRDRQLLTFDAALADESYYKLIWKLYRAFPEEDNINPDQRGKLDEWLDWWNGELEGFGPTIGMSIIDLEEAKQIVQPF